MTELPLVLINFKKVTGPAAMALADELSTASCAFRHLFEIVLAVQACDAPGILERTDLPIYVHDVCETKPLCETFAEDDLIARRISGLLVNHPESRLLRPALLRNIQYAKEHQLRLIVGSTGIEQALTLHLEFAPQYIAIENMQLMGTPLSLCEHCPDSVRQAAGLLPCKLLFGAGVRKSGDIAHVLENGGFGVLVSSVITGANCPGPALVELLAGVLNEEPVKSKSLQDQNYQQIK